MEITCAWCGEGVSQGPFFHSLVHKARLKRTGLELEQYDEQWICADCMERIEECLGDLYDDMQQD